ncbi:FAD-dependent oxidoreductase [Levilactobacillus suantsaii]|uniref:FAD-binding protein n=1 Tax=Levilactobacillus suantsaii TaxID=2292255 RepID=A0A4Q0VJJ7_9LACO|nr:FAD-binding protein [Levilactobacillus suantsaii]QMU07285.1 FAD-binding protein [Levilactobacillus suantsaii]RXI77917.1 FAD-binding protein [Levilactobacillus suantsaii]
MTQTTYDVIVVGAANAGGFAAGAAAEKGAKVLVIDKKSSSDHLYRNTIASVDSAAQKRAGVHIDKRELVEFLSAFAQDNVDQKLLWTWVNHSGEAMDWLEEQVLKTNGDHLHATGDAYYEHLINKAFPSGNEVTRDEKSWDQGWGKYVIQKDRDLGVTFKYRTKLENLLTDAQNRVVGVRVKDTETNAISEFTATKGVILCTGGYGANEALMQKWAPTLLQKNTYTQSPRDDGSGQLAALAVGAARDDEPASIIFDRGAVPVGTNIDDYYVKDWKSHQFVLGSYPLLKVNLKGERFFNESAPYQFAMNSLRHQPGHLEVMVWNQKTMDNLQQFHTLGCSRLGWPGIFGADGEKKLVQQYLEKGYVKQADSIEELAHKMQLPADQLQKTVARYNDLCAAGEDQDFGKESYRMFPVDGGPYYAVTLGGILLATLDGLHVNERMQVLDRNADPIQGLYAAGNCAGGFFWGAYPDRVPGLTASHAVTFGRLAGQTVLA